MSCEELIERMEKDHAAEIARRDAHAEELEQTIRRLLTREAALEWAIRALLKAHVGTLRAYAEEAARKVLGDPAADTTGGDE